MDINRQTTYKQRNITMQTYNNSDKSGTSHMARGMGLLERKRLNSQRAQKDSDKSINSEQEDH